MSENMKKFTKLDKDIKLVLKPNDLDPYDDDPGVLRAVLSCGHITDPQTLTDCCRAQLNDGQTEFRCPLCEEQWPYDEVRKLAKLTIDEQKSFEDTVGKNTVKKIVDFKEMPLSAGESENEQLHKVFEQLRKLADQMTHLESSIPLSTEESVNEKVGRQTLQPQLHEVFKELRKVADQMTRLESSKQQRESRNVLDESMLECPICGAPYPASQHRELLAHLDYCFR